MNYLKNINIRYIIIYYLTIINKKFIYLNFNTTKNTFLNITYIKKIKNLKIIFKKKKFILIL